MGYLSSLNSGCIDRGCFAKFQDEITNAKLKKLPVRASIATSSSQSLEFEEIKGQKFEKFRAGVLGASGYTGSEIIRLLANHPNFQITLMTADRKAGQSIGSVFPHLVKHDLPDLVAVKDADFSKANLIEVKNIIIDSKSGVSGAGRGAKEANLYTEIAEGIHSYGVTRHCHGLSEAAKSEVTVSFTPHLMPMSRGMQSTIYVEMAHGASVQHLSNFYEA